MAESETDPPDKGPDIFIEGHKNRRVTQVVCIICEKVYYRSEFIKYKDTKFIGKLLVICPKHDGINLTSKYSDEALNETAKIIISQIKQNAKKDIIEEIQNESIKEKDLNATIHRECSECEIIKSENVLLKQLNCEMQDKNSLLKELLLNEKENIKEHKMTYAEIISKVKPQPKRIPKIKITKTNKKSKEDLKKNVAYYLTKEKSIQAKNVNFKSDEQVIINCLNEESANEAEKILSRKLSNFCKIEKEQIENPKLKIVGIDNFLELDSKALEHDINDRNFRKFENKIQILHMYTNNNSGKITAIVEVTPEIYKYIKENKGKVFVGYQNCKVYDIINVKPCFKCGRFGHSSKKCENDIACLICAESHKTDKCKKENSQCCLNCQYSNTKYKTKLDTKHVATDCNRCEILKKKIKKFIEMTNYPIKPDIPAFLGNVEYQKKSASLKKNDSSSSIESAESAESQESFKTIQSGKNLLADSLLYQRP